MFLHYSSRFKKSFRKRPEWIRELVEERTRLFAQDPRHPLLGDHPLGGKLAGLRSFSIMGDLRVQYEPFPDGSVRLTNLGTHSELYG
ncbi:MAG: type II toxin-antitoxin system YafQ family toxin [Candidatus Paceibacterota bacterium]|jgi:mRNA-degrading endonuclease YafQ of YafQ-DinJ toxin-antitoxin module